MSKRKTQRKFKSAEIYGTYNSAKFNLKSSDEIVYWVRVKISLDLNHSEHWLVTKYHVKFTKLQITEIKICGHRELFWRNAKYMQLVLFQDTSSDSLRIEKSIVEETVKYMYIANILAVHLSILNTVFFVKDEISTSSIQRSNFCFWRFLLYVYIPKLNMDRWKISPRYWL